jgi:type IV secretory pathway component VirB8
MSFDPDRLRRLETARRRVGYVWCIFFVLWIASIIWVVIERMQ